MVGAESLRHSIPEVSRRQAAQLKRETLREMERERVEATTQVTFAAPAIVRGFDAMYLQTTQGRRYALISADAAVPYRTSAVLVERYDGVSVARAVEEDFRRNGAPLVWRADRASCHKVDEVTEVLRSYGVLLLHGPPRYPQYYGQLERQNREHRAWLGRCGELTTDQLPATLDRMRFALNHLWKRATLGWRTAADLWNQRMQPALDRSALAAEVRDRTLRLRRRLDPPRHEPNLPERLAIQQVLGQHGLLNLTVGGSC
jgi:hypothetical protein